MRNSKILKVLSYILIPVLMIAIIINIIYATYIADNNDFLTKENYIETTSFYNNYDRAISEIAYQYRNEYFLETNDIMYLYESRHSEALKFLIIDKTTDNHYSNLYNMSVEEIKDALNKESYYYYCYDNEVFTNIPNEKLYTMDMDTFNKDRFVVYTAFSDASKINNNTYFENIFFEYSKSNNTFAIYVTPIYIVLEILLVIYLLWSIGHKKGDDKIYQNWFDKWPVEIILAIGVLIDIILFFLITCIADINSYYALTEVSVLMYSFIGIILASIYTATAIMGTSIIKKLKTNTLIKTSLTFKICKKIFNWIKSICTVVLDNLGTNVKIVFIILALILMTLLLNAVFGNLGILLSIIIYIYSIYLIMKKLYQFNKLKNNLKQIYYGNMNITINKEEYKGELKEIATYINEISNGLENAVNEKLKSERLKTELITNVSHDIKTPLTSIINYVDLIKKENIEEKKIREYVDILDNKSQRLKRLIEDLVEASKVTSGNIKLDIQSINLVELINQTIGEFTDKFAEKNLNLFININKKEEYKIEADTRYMYRVVENLFTNIYKYALENSRVYIDIREEKGIITFEIKNISKEPLNITEAELMERFVRGDKSRTTEGSGLRFVNSKEFNKTSKWKI